MTHPNKVKGNTFEREIVNCAKNKNLDAKRAYASDGRSLGLHQEVDCVVKSQGVTWKIQAKRKKSLPKWLQTHKSVDAVCFRADRSNIKIMIDYEDFLDLIGGKYE